MVVAELEVFHSRPIAPTRRVALGRRDLPVEPAPGFGGVLLGAIAARFVNGVDPDLRADLFSLTDQVEAGMRIPQPRLRYRLQHDRIGLTRTRHRLHLEGEHLRFEIDDTRAAPAQHVLAAVYAAGEVLRPGRWSLMTAVRRGLRWTGEVGPALVVHLTAGSGHTSWFAPAGGDQIAWALDVLGLERNGSLPTRAAVQNRFRLLLRDAHPDHGGEWEEAASRIRVLTEARRILLA